MIYSQSSIDQNRNYLSDLPVEPIVNNFGVYRTEVISVLCLAAKKHQLPVVLSELIKYYSERMNNIAPAARNRDLETFLKDKIKDLTTDFGPDLNF